MNKSLVGISAFFFAVASAITPNAKVTLKNVTLNPTRIEAYKVLEKMGTKISFITREDIYEPIGDIVVEYAPLKGVTVDSNIAWLIDELPALSIVMAIADGKSLVKNAEELRVKESDRIQVMADGLITLGIDATPTADGICIQGGVIGGGEVESHGDHRIAMAFSVASICAIDTITINDCTNVNTSFPGFVDLATSTGMKVKSL